MKVTSSEEDIGIVLLLVSLVCLGTWPALLRLASTAENSLSSSEQQRHEEATGTGSYSSLQRSTDGAYTSVDASNPADAVTTILPATQKDPLQVVCHAYLDYATAYFLASSIPFVIASLRSTSSKQQIWSVPPLPLL